MVDANKKQFYPKNISSVASMIETLFHSCKEWRSRSVKFQSFCITASKPTFEPTNFWIRFLSPDFNPSVYNIDKGRSQIFPPEIMQTLSHRRKKTTKQFSAVREELGILFRCQEPAISNENNFGGFAHFVYPSIIYGVHAVHWSDCFDTHPEKNSTRKNRDFELSKTFKNII